MVQREEPADSLRELRNRLAQVDRRVVALVSDRQRLVAEIGRVKQEAGVATRDYGQEKEVLERVRREAVAFGLDEGLVDGLFALLIRSSLAIQERDRIQADATGSGRRALVIGGGGRMGSWFVEFLASQGFEVQIADPAGGVHEFKTFEDWRDLDLVHDVIVVATPIEVTQKILPELARAKPAGLVFDTASLKGPLEVPLKALVKAGVRATSVHPMFGPDTKLLSDRHIIFVDLGVKEATEEAKTLFSPTMARLVDMKLAQHDQLMAFVLGLSHALNLAFATALAESGEEIPSLAEISSTTFDAQLEVASKVTAENPDLYFEIQTLNEFGQQSLDALATAVKKLRSAVVEGQKDAFVALMLDGRNYFNERRRGRPPSR